VGLHQFKGAFGLADWISFDDPESFKAYMEQDIPYTHNSVGTNTVPVPDTPITYYDPYGNEITREEALTEHLYEGTEIVLSYVRLNEEVSNVQYQIQNGEILRLEVLTWDAFYQAQRELKTFDALFTMAYLAEYGLALVLYFVKRKKA